MPPLRPPPELLLRERERSQLLAQGRKQGATGVCRRLKTKLRGLKELTIEAVMACAAEAARETVQP